MEKASNIERAGAAPSRPQMHHASSFCGPLQVRSLVFGVRRLAFLLLIVSAAPLARAESLLPTQHGATWNYEVRDPTKDPEPTSLTVRVAGTEQMGDKDLLKFETVVNETVVKTELISVDERGVLCHQRAGADGKATILEPPQMIIPFPLKIGASWEVNDHVSGGGPQQFTVTAEQDVTVPAGKFRAFRLHCEQPWPISTTTERWFAPGTGVIADVTTTRGPGGRLLSRATTMLKKFEVIPTKPDDSAPSITIDAAAPSAAATPTAAPQPGILLEVSGEREGLPQTEFKSDAQQIFVRWSGVNLPVGEAVRVAWIAEDVGDLAPANFIIDQMETVIETAEFGARFTLSRPKDGWAAGKYRVEVYLGDELVQKLNVTITD